MGGSIWDGTLLGVRCASLPWNNEPYPRNIAGIPKCNDRCFVLLAFCPVEEGEGVSALDLFHLITDTLYHYNKPWESVDFMIGDN
ncbi:hypothetical protein BBJ28_00022004 [Nothophytophthora sp. Chile5]|nr:hypothetical protein BBJ28_00022004 [Nothophytophthora sp. Chile5]